MSVEDGTTLGFRIPAASVPTKVHEDCHLLVLQYRGSSRFTLDGRSFELAVGHALWVPAGVMHSLYVREDSVLLPMTIPGDRITEALESPIILDVDRDLHILCLVYIQSLYSLIRPEGDFGEQLITLIDKRLTESTTLPMPSSPAPLHIARILCDNPADDRSIGELARAAHSSERTIERLFQAETGTTFRRWRRHNRMESAGLLLRSFTTIDATAQRVGYQSTNAFRRAFKAHFGHTPSEYIAQFQLPSRREFH
jgi:AraC-type DNA-binding domain-containing proteins